MFLVGVLFEEFFDEGDVLIADEIRLSRYAKLRPDVGSGQNSLVHNLASHVGSVDQYLYVLGVGNLKDVPSKWVQAVCWWIVLGRSPLLMPPTPSCCCFPHFGCPKQFPPLRIVFVHPDVIRRLGRYNGTPRLDPQRASLCSEQPNRW